MLSPISSMLWLLADYRWLVFHMFVSLESFDAVCEQEDEREYYENSDEEVDDDDEDYEEYEEDGSEHGVNKGTDV
ncbi:hypothetical protein [Candidatus Hodgkinia cicadicola]|uniref:hypothetical protein n=1 Tax=Candidatus Hodgkinia cicadicola TaxID=573658 RepID=UPI001788DCC1